MENVVSLLDYLRSDKDFSTLALNRLVVRNESIGEEKEVPCMIFKELSEKIVEFNAKNEVGVRYSFFEKDGVWAMVTAIRLGSDEMNTYLNIFTVESEEHIGLLKEINKQKGLKLVFYNERMEVASVQELERNPFYHNIGAVLNEIRKTSFANLDKAKFIELKREILKKFNNDAREFYTHYNS